MGAGCDAALHSPRMTDELGGLSHMAAAEPPVRLAFDDDHLWRP